MPPRAEDGGEGNGHDKRQRFTSYIDKQIIAHDRQDPNKPEPAQSERRRETKKGPSKLMIAIAVGAVLSIASVGGGILFGLKLPFFTTGEQVKKLVADADDAIKYGDYDDAADYLTKAIQLDPNKAELYEKRGLAKILMHRNDVLKDAIDDFDKAIKLDPKYFEAYLDRANAKTESAQFESAISDYNKLISLGKDVAKVRFGRGLANYYNGNVSGAIDDFKAAIDKDSNYADAMIALGTAYYKQNRREEAWEQFGRAKDPHGVGLHNQAIILVLNAKYSDAVSKYSEAIDVNPSDANLFIERGLARLHLQNEEENAAYDFHTAQQRDPNLQIAKENLNAACKLMIDRGSAMIRSNNFRGYGLIGSALTYLGRTNAAIYYLNSAVARNPQYSDGLRLLGNCYSDLGLYDEAIDIYTSALQRDPRDAKIYAKRCWAFYRRGKSDEALADANKAIELGFKESDPYIVKAGVEEDRGHLDEALKDGTRLVELEPKQAIHYSNRALTYELKKQYKDAERDFRKAIELDPGLAHAYKCMGAMFTDLGKKDEALRYLTKAIEVEPGQDTYPSRIRYFTLIRDYPKALADGNALLEQNPSNPTNLVRRAFLYFLCGDNDNALKDYNKAIEMKASAANYAERAEYYLRSGQLTDARKDTLQAVSIDPKDGDSALPMAVLMGMQEKRWSDAENYCNQWIAAVRWDDTGAYDASLRLWVCLNLDKQPEKAKNVLAEAKEHSGTLGWPTPIVKYLLGDIDSKAMMAESFGVPDDTDAHFYAGMKLLFDHDQVGARKELEWVVREGYVNSHEYVMAQQMLKMMDNKEI